MGACELKGLIFGPAVFFRMLPFCLPTVGGKVGGRGKTVHFIFNKVLSPNHLPSFD